MQWSLHSRQEWLSHQYPCYSGASNDVWVVNNDVENCSHMIGSAISSSTCYSHSPRCGSDPCLGRPTRSVGHPQSRKVRRHLTNPERGERDGSSSTLRSTKTLWCCPRLLPHLRFILIQLFISGCSSLHYWQEFWARTWCHTSTICFEFIPASHYPGSGRMMSELACQAVHLKRQKSLHCELFHWIVWLRLS